MNGIHSQSKLLLLLLLIGLVSGCSRNDDPEETPEEPAPTNTAPAITDPELIVDTGLLLADYCFPCPELGQKQHR